MSSPLENLQPSLVWRHFAAICQIPHPSKHEAQLAEHVVNWATGKGLEVRRDAAGNVVVAVPATPGHESAPVIVLQGHLDMVGEANSDTPFDFTVEPIQPRVVGDHVYATGTTLGADNGIGVAAAMAIVEDPDAVYGPLELLFTIDEETGLTGAMQLDPKLLTGRTLINLDTEEDGALYIGCAGGADTKSTFTITREDAMPGTLAIRLSVRGLRGGHSGVDIHENRGNALKFLVRLLQALRRAGIEVGIVSLSGGSKHNAIPREADAILRINPEDEVRLRQVVEEKAAILREEFGEIDPGQRIEVETVSADATTASVWLPFDADRILDALMACPHGVLGMSRAVPGLVETSSNLAVIRTEDTTVWVQTSSRSSVMPSLKATLDQVAAVFRLAGAEVETHDGYPGWKPNPASPVLGTARQAFVRLFGREPHIKAIHAGLECGLIGEKLPGIDMVSMGPQIESPHSPDERVQISTVDRFYTLLKATLKDLA
ncbi:MAG TPA: aminoacyl-histidine dipeptidase [Thermoanaerobaculaceae bacterium]|nr:aminoacyl-histidine dipeptidase [Thermoanaerobaculaceae bacterium]HRS14985.1 aminoacyl-histidine dipeptidase [Thermoanaerobaculaceae bacterium]